MRLIDNSMEWKPGKSEVTKRAEKTVARLVDVALNIVAIVAVVIVFIAVYF